MNARRTVSLLICAACLASLPSIVFAATVVGRVLLSAGDAAAVRDGREVRLAFGASIEYRDLLRTGAASNLQVRFTDESIVSLQENSQLNIEQYNFGGKEDGTERAFFRLVKGGLRAITGLIGRTNHQNYGVQTVTATIGVRGTDWGARECHGDCGGAVKDGLYASVYGTAGGTNAITVATNAGQAVLGINEHCYVPDANSLPQPLLERPTVVSTRPQGKAETPTGGTAGSTGGEQTASGSGAQADSRSGIAASPQPVDVGLTVTNQYQSTEQRNASGQLSVVTGNTSGLALAFDYTGSGLAVGTFNASVSTSGTGSAQTLTGFTGLFENGTITASGSQGPGGSDMTGFDPTVNGYYGRWKDGTISIAGSPSITPGTGVHYMYGFDFPDASAFAPRVGVFQFNRVAGTTPTDGNGNIASSYSFGPMLVEFQHLAGVLGTSSWTIAGVTHRFSNVDLTFHNEGGGRITFDGSNNPLDALSGVCTGGLCSTGTFAYAQVTGAFVGSAGDHAAVTWGTTSLAGPTASAQLYSCANCSSNNGIPLAGVAVAFAGPSVSYNAAAADASVKASPYMVFSGSNLTSFNDFSRAGNVNGSNVNTGVLGPINGGFGRWSSGQITQIDQVGFPATPFVPGTGVHWLYGDLAFPDVVMARTGIVSFPWVAGTNPTYSDGTVGSWNAGNIAVNFTNQTAAMNASWQVGLETYTLTNTPLQLQRDNLQVTLRTANSQPLFNDPSTTCAGSGCAGRINMLNVRGVFMGGLGNHIGTSISTFQGGTLNKGSSSVQVFSCSGQPGC